MGEWFAQPLLLLLGPAALALLALFERWRRRPLTLVVADLSLFEVTPEIARAAARQRRRTSRRFLLRAAAALALSAGVAGAQLPAGQPGPLVLDLVLDRGLESGARHGAGTRLDAHREHLRAVVARLRPIDRVRLHLLPPRGPVVPLGPQATLAVLDRLTPLAARAQLEPTVARLAPRAHAEGRPPLFLAGSRRLPAQPGLAQALAAEAVRDRGLTALTQEGGALHAAVVVHDHAGPLRVVFHAGDASVEVQGEVGVELPADGARLVSWPLPPEAPAAITWARAELRGGGDDLPSNDVAYAAAPALERRVGILGKPGPWVRRALGAVPGTQLVELDRSSLEAAGELDLLVVPSLALVEDAPGAGLVVVPPTLSSRAVDGGPVRGEAHPAFTHTQAAVEADPFVVARVGPLPRLPRARAVLHAGDRPLVVIQGEGAHLIAAVAVPLTREASAWPERESFPLFWAELLALAAPRTGGRLASHPAGTLWDGPEGQRLPLEVELTRDPDGDPLLGTAAPRPVWGTETLDQAFASDALESLDARRPREAPTPVAPWVGLLGLALALVSWRPTAPATRTQP